MRSDYIATYRSPEGMPMASVYGLEGQKNNDLPSLYALLKVREAFRISIPTCLCDPASLYEPL